MFCHNCGYELSGETNFCPNCGNKTIFLEKKKENTDTLNKDTSRTDRNREVIIRYLYNLRALEVAKEKLKKELAENTEKCKQLGVPQLFTKPKFKNRNTILLYGILSFVFAAFMVFISCVHKSGLLTVTAIISLIISVFYIVYYSSKQINYNREYSSYANSVSIDRKRVEQELNEKKKIEKKTEGIKKELNEAEDILEKSYCINIIPKQFRDIYSIIYLYEYLSTSQESLQSALLHYNLEEIKTKIDEVIRQQSEIILQQAIQTAHLEVIENQNTRILKHAAETEQNTALAAQYAQIAANNAEACAWINLAQYIKD